MPSTVVPGAVDDAGAKAGPGSRGTPSGPWGELVPVIAPLLWLAVVVFELVAALELEPQPAAQTAASARRSSEARRRRARLVPPTAEQAEHEQEHIEDVEE